MRPRKKSYVISVSGIVAALTLSSDLFGIATMISGHFSLAIAFAPWVGTTLAAGFGTWFLLSVAIDGPRYYNLKKRQRRRRTIATMQRVADAMEWYADTGESSFSVYEDHTWSSERTRADISLDVEQLERLELMPLPRNKKTRHNDVANHLYRTIPVVERKGISHAREMTRNMNAFWKKHAEKGDEKWGAASRMVG